MSKDVVIIPVFNRPEYLLVTLQLLKSQVEAIEHHFLFAVDFGHDKNNLKVIQSEMKGYTYSIMYNNGSHYRELKQSYNLLKAYEHATTLTNGLIYMVEDDIFTAVSFFRTHRQIHAKEPNLFCVTANFLNNKDFVCAKTRQTMNKETYNVSFKSIYQSLGVSFKSDVVKKFIIPHCNALYFINPAKYIKQYFSKHPLSTNYREQDGLIRRVADISQLGIAYPDYPRCYHAGVYGYHRHVASIRSKSFEQKVKFIIDTCFDEKKMQQYNQYNDVFVSDINVNNDICLKNN